MKYNKDIKPAVVFEGDFMQAALIKNLLEHNEIQVFIENQLVGSIAPWQVTAGGLNPVKVVVSSLDYDQAIRLVEDFNKEN